MIDRFLLPRVLQALDEMPAVCLLGPRQVGKTTLALAIAERREAVYLDLESEQDRAKLYDPEAYLAPHLDKLVILDELHRAPALFPVLRGMIDRARRQGRRTGLYLLWGSASLGLLRQSGESLAGRVRFMELTPFLVRELIGEPLDRLWLRGGFLDSVLAVSAPDGTELYFYRTSGGAEVDLLLLLPGGEKWAVEIKRSLAPRPKRGFHAACLDLQPDRAFVVYPGTERYPLSDKVEAISLSDMASELVKYLEVQP